MFIYIYICTNMYLYVKQYVCLYINKYLYIKKHIKYILYFKYKYIDINIVYNFKIYVYIFNQYNIFIYK